MKSKITQLLLSICILLFAGLIVVNAQSTDYKTAPGIEGSNYYDIVNQKRAEFNTLKAERNLTRGENKTFKHFERWAYFWQDRVDANGKFPSPLEGWKNAGLLDRKPVVSNQSAARESLSSESWTNIGPQANPLPNGYPNPPQLGRLNAFWRYVAPSAANNVLIVGAPTGGIWKSTDNGATWSPKFDTFAGIGITDIKGSSSDIATTGVLYATTGDYDGSEVLNSIGIYKSTDMGETWTATGLTFALSGVELLGHMVVYDDNTVVVGAKNDIKKTTDGGANWTDVYTGEFVDQKFGRMASSGTNIVCGDSFGALFFSTDSGDNWAELTLTPASTGKISVTADDSGTFFIQKTDGQVMQLDLTGGGSASNFGTIPAAYDSQGGYNQVLLKRGSLLLEGSVNGNSSDDSGATWYLSLNGYKSSGADPGVYMHSDHHQAGYLDAGLSFWNVNDGGLNFINYTSASDQMPTLEYKSNGVVTTQVYTISINPASGSNSDFMMANQDNDGFSFESGSWVSAIAGDGVASAIDYSTPGIRYLGGTTGSLVRSDATGFDGNYEGNSLTTPGNAEFVWPLSLDTTTSTTLFGGFDEFYTSTDKGDNWTNLNAGAGKPVTFDNQGSNIAIVGTTGLVKSSNSGANWSSISQPGSEQINSFSIDAATPLTMYATVKGYNDGNKVYKSTDGGSIWTNISTGMPNILMKKVMFKQNQTGEYLFAATELGVYYMSPTVTTWTKLGTNLPNVIVNDMKINYMNDKLYVGTYGRGMWEINIANPTLGVEEDSFNAEFKVFPNPVTNNELNVHLSANEGSVDYIIYNIVGGVVGRGTFNQLQNTVKLNSPATGMYIIRMNSGNKVYSHKFIIK